MSGPPRALAPNERMARVIYTAMWFVATPAIALYLLWRSRRQPAYRRDWAERFLGRYGRREPSRCIWIHAVSVGETRAAAPLIERLQARYPGYPVLVTNMTPTGRETARGLFGDRVRHGYLAYDYPHAVAAFFRHWRPVVGIVMETEIWPNLMDAAARAGTPMLLANARLSAKSLVAARRWPALMRPAARRFERILAQTDADANRFAILTESEFDPLTRQSIVTVGNVKFDSDVPPAQRERATRFREWLGGTSGTPPRVFLVASTREGEEEDIFDAWLRHGVASRRAGDDARVVLAVVPRHPQRFDEVLAAARARGLVTQRRSDERVVAPDVEVWLGDSMGELWAYYLVADVAYVGGSIVPLGGQNLIEAAAAGCPVLLGRHTFNFTAASDEAVRMGAAVRVDDYDALIVAGLALAGDEARRRRMSEAGKVFAANHRGATDRSLAIVAGILGARPTAGP